MRVECDYTYEGGTMSKYKKNPIIHEWRCLRFVGPGAGPCVCWLIRGEREETLADAKKAIEVAAERGEGLLDAVASLDALAEVRKKP
jgi:hypothetical protein